MAYQAEEFTSQEEEFQATDYPTVEDRPEQSDIPRHAALDPYTEGAQEESS
jgi:hypothetical protein